jgi:uncharacterized protein with PQ loop repeat
MPNARPTTATPLTRWRTALAGDAHRHAGENGVHNFLLLPRRGVVDQITRKRRLVIGVDALAYAVSFLSLLFTLDQIRIVWIDRNVSGVSLLSWAFYAASAFVWLCYGLIHKDKVIAITNLLWVAFSLFVVVGVAVR